MSTGTVFWITGISGAGKTTVARSLYQHIKANKPNVVLLDGDELRAVYGNDLKHHRSDRLACAMRNARLCKLLSDQGIDVICATISLFHECHDWLREHIENYREILLDVPVEVATSRDKKNIYKPKIAGEESPIVGIDIALELPKNPDIVFQNDGSIEPSKIVETLIKHFSKEEFINSTQGHD